MTNSDDDKKLQLKQNLETNFNFSVDLSTMDHELDTESAYFKFLKQKLSERIKFYINTDLEKLLQALYRIDIDERLTDQAFHLGEVNLVSDKLAELIIIRQLQKLDYSRKFKGF